MHANTSSRCRDALRQHYEANDSLQNPSSREKALRWCPNNFRYSDGNSSMSIKQMKANQAEPSRAEPGSRECEISHELTVPNNV
ncbi:unnamed protein product [Citrullus colocynthis]|uniref:Uncharacterized protein n=1 Tax=Citrullus colocynthis TaxID=252529 RepID=A0ABP0XUT5_9ROSI